MTFRETTLASGIPARICRISFSGELAFEVNVSGWYGAPVWEEIYAAGAGVRHHPVRHRDHARAARREGLPDRRPGHRRHRHPAGRRHGVGRLQGRRTSSASGPTAAPTPPAPTASTWSVLPVDRTMRLPEGTQLIGRTALDDGRRRRCRCSGHVTSSYHSAALGRSFALALIKDGRNRIGQTLLAPGRRPSWSTSSWPRPSSTTPKGPGAMVEPDRADRCAAARWHDLAPT